MPCRARWEYLKSITSTSHLSAFGGEIPVLRHLDLELYGGLHGTNNAVISDVPLLHSMALLFGR
jgi:hypothetical protein